MIILKSEAELAVMRQGGRILAKIIKELVKSVKVGITTAGLEELALKLIKEAGANPAFKNYHPPFAQKPFPTALCACLNEEIVHAPAIPSRTLREGDLLTLDLGLEYRSYFTDMAVTVGVGKISEEAKKLLKVTIKALNLAIKQVRPGNYLSQVSGAIQKYVESQGFSVIKDLVGHGVGKEIHEPPSIPNFVGPGYEEVELQTGMTLAIEPMVALGSAKTITKPDGWTVATAESLLTAHFEHTVLVTKEGYEILTE